MILDWFQQGQPISDVILQNLAQMQQSRRLKLKRAWDHYNGAFPKALLPTKTDPKADDNISVNLCRLAVDVSAFFLFGKPLAWDVDGGASRPASDDPSQPAARSEQETWLDECWTANKQSTTLLDLAINGGVTGDAFIRVRMPAPGQQYPRLIVLDPESVTAISEPDDYQAIVEYRVEWTGIDPVRGKPIAFRTVITPNDNGLTWEVVDYQSPADSPRWTETGRAPWPYKFAPIFHAKNRPCPNSFYGTADLEDDVIDANEDLNFSLSNTQRILRVHAHPKTWMRGAAAKDLDMSVDKVTVINAETGMLANLEMQSDLASSMAFAQVLKQSYHEVSSVPEVTTGKVDNIGPLSGLALSILYGPLLRLTATKQMFYGEMLSELNQALLWMAFTKDFQISLQWPDLLPKDNAASASAATAKQDAGVSRDTTLAEMGYDPAVEASKRQKQAQEQAQFGSSLLDAFSRDGLTTGVTPGDTMVNPAGNGGGAP